MIEAIESIKAIEKELGIILDKFTQAVKLNPGDILVIGCSTSEIIGAPIGKSPEYSIGEAVAKTFIAKFAPLKVYLAFQCCEHLNRALVVERELTENKKGPGQELEIVSVVPHENAGGSAASAAYNLFCDPVVVEFIKANAGIDIGGTFIGMHLKHVAIPVKLDISKLGAANVTYAAARPKYIGGERAKY